MTKKTTKTQQLREKKYRDQLRRCGFRSWCRANDRRYALINAAIADTATSEEQDELRNLQHLADLYVAWKTNDSRGRAIQRLKRLEKRLGL